MRKLLLRCLLLAAVLPCARLEAAPAEPPGRQDGGPRLLWADPEGLNPFAIELLAGELAAMGKAMGAAIELRAAAPAEQPGELRYRVLLMRAPEAHWRLRPDVLAAAPRAEGYQGTIYVFLEQVQRTLGHIASLDVLRVSQQQRELVTALARIIAHEVVHVVAPDHPHATSGLMVAQLRRRSLVRRNARVDPACALAYREALATD